MLEKHLGHLKKPAPGMEHLAPRPPPQHPGAKHAHSLKSEDSPATSPATASNWNSPGNLTGASPVASNVTDEYMHAVQGHPGGPYQVPAGMLTPGGVHQQAMAYAGSPQQRVMGGPGPRPLPPPQLQQPPHRRHISEISGGPSEMGGDVKRQVVYTPGPQGPMSGPMPPHMGQPQQMGQPMPGGSMQMNPMQHSPMQRRAG